VTWTAGAIVAAVVPFGVAEAGCTVNESDEGTGGSGSLPPPQAVSSSAAQAAARAVARDSAWR